MRINSNSVFLDLAPTHLKGRALSAAWAVTFLIPLAVGCSRGNLANPFNGATPSIQKVIPDSGKVSGGIKIAVVGSNFVSGAKVMLGDVECQDVQVLSTISLTCTVPAYQRPTQVDVVVINPNKFKMELRGGFTFTDEMRPVAGVGISAGGQTARSTSFSTDVQVGFIGSGPGAGANPIQKSSSFTHLPGSIGARFGSP